MAVDLQDFHSNDVPFVQLIADAFHTFVRYLRDVHQPVFARQYGYESAKVHQFRDTTLIDLSNFDVGRNQFDFIVRHDFILLRLGLPLDILLRLLWQPGDLGVLEGVAEGVSKDARTRGFASLALARFAFS